MTVIRSFLSKYRVVILVFLLVYSLDRVTKYLVVHNLSLGQSWPSHCGFFCITYIANSGSAFGLFGGQNMLLTFASLIGVGVLILFYRTHPSPGLLVRLSLGLMLAGALGNLTDRVLLGQVTDFIHVGPWYIFNVADSSIVTGVIILGASMLFQKEPERAERENTGDIPAGASGTEAGHAESPRSQDHDHHGG